MKDWIKISEYHKMMESSKWTQEIPFIKFPKEWEVKIIPPFAGAVVRFMIKKGDATVSVYLDCYNQLGFCGQPYWEAYPVNHDVYRCPMDNTDKLLFAIKKSLDQQSL